MNPNKHKIIIEHSSDAYEFTIEDKRVLRITKFVGSSGMSREVLYDYVPEKVKEELHQTLE